MKSSFSGLKRLFTETPLFNGKSWRIALEPWRFSPEVTAELSAIGQATLAFYRAQEKLYLASAFGKSLLRNKTLLAPWVAELLDRGKPDRLICHQRSRALTGKFPTVLRPDLLITERGFSLTEFDSVPGGIGLTAFLSRLYNCGNAMAEEFWKTLTRENPSAKIAVAVSDESATYRPEFEWLAETLCRECGAEIFVCNPNELRMNGNGVFLGRVRIDVVYRFFELFDLKNFSDAEKLMEAVESGKVSVTPPMRAFQEEKLSLALFHHPTLKPFWLETLGAGNFAVLQKIIPETWILEPVENLPPGALLWAPLPIRDWSELKNRSSRERNWVLKSGGFDENAWGARSVTVGNDVSQGEWNSALDAALASGRQNKLYVLQDFKKPICRDFEIFNDAGVPETMAGRVRICPYYFLKNNETVHLAGALATVCPADKKIIHGMSSASLAPCRFAF